MAKEATGESPPPTVFRLKIFYFISKVGLIFNTQMSRWFFSSSINIIKSTARGRMIVSPPYCVWAVGRKRLLHTTTGGWGWMEGIFRFGFFLISFTNASERRFIFSRSRLNPTRYEIAYFGKSAHENNASFRSWLLAHRSAAPCHGSAGGARWPDQLTTSGETVALRRLLSKGLFYTRGVRVIFGRIPSRRRASCEIFDFDLFTTLARDIILFSKFLE